MCLCCLGWGLFLWNYLNGQGRAPTVEDVGPNVKILAGQGIVACLDYFVWTRFFALGGSALYAVVFVFDVFPFVAQAFFIRYLLSTATTNKAAAAAPKKACCGGDVETRRLEKEAMLA